MSTSVKLGHVLIGKSINQTLYKSMRGILLYLTVNRPNITSTRKWHCRLQKPVL